MERTLLSITSDGPSGHLFSEDTPQLAVARDREVENLEKILVYLTRRCPTIQKEPNKALCRFLLSSKLVEPRKLTNDPLLTSCGSFDKSICYELKRNPKHARSVCETLCDASRQAVVRLNGLKTIHSPSDVQLGRDDGKWRVSWGDASIYIEDGLLNRLQRMYRKKNPRQPIAADVPWDERFKRRLFCMLMRYKSLGGQDNMIKNGCCFSHAPKLISEETWAAFEALGVTKECMASPFNSSASRFWSVFGDTDCFFGSEGNFFDASDGELREGGSFMANGPPVEETLEVLEKRIREVLEQNTQPTSFIVGSPNWPDMLSWKNLKASRYLVFHLNECTVYNFGKMSLFILQNEAGRQKWPVTAESRAKLKKSFRVVS
jgi:hypothetical protein